MYNSKILSDEDWNSRPFPRTYKLEIEGSWLDIEADSEEDAISQAASEAAENWEPSDSTIFVSWNLYDTDQDGNNKHIEGGTLQLDPPEPECDHVSGHDWRSPYSLVGGCKENPGVTGNGGGVIITQVCVRCGCEKVTDTWAQNPSTGEQGFTTACYTPEEYQINNELEAIRWDGNIGKWCGRWFCKATSDSFDTKKEAQDYEYKDV